MSEQFALAIRTDIHIDSRLLFVASHEGFSEYADENGAPVYLAHGTARRLLSFDELMDSLGTLWAQSQYPGYLGGRYDLFLDELRALTYEPDRIDEEIRFCADCREPDHYEELHYTNDGEEDVCENCFGGYYFCADCEMHYRYTTTIGDNEVCECCRDNYLYCEDCDEWYGEGWQDEHEHYSDCCEAPMQSFTVRNDGNDPLPNDTRTTVSLPAGEMSDEGIDAIAALIRREGDPYDETDKHRTLSWDLERLGNRWQTKEGNYTKRLSRLAYKSHGLKLSPELVSAVGNLAREHSSTSPEFHIEVTRDLNQPAAEFAHEGSCYWTSYSSSRCTLKSNGGFGLRSFGDYGVTGRAWVVPLRMEYPGAGAGELRPTLDALTPDALVVFNGYGDLEGYAAARIVSHMAGMTYRKVGFTFGCAYINAGGYLIAPEEIAENYTDGHLNLDVETHATLTEGMLTHV